jgi:hypothetical protein
MTQTRRRTNGLLPIAASAAQAEAERYAERN